MADDLTVVETPESPTPSPEPPPTDPTPAEPPAAVAPPAPQMVPLAVALEERRARQELQRQVDFLQGQLQKPPAPAAPASPSPADEDPDAVEYARTLSLFRADGTPDAASGRKLLSIAEKRAEIKTKAAMQEQLQQHVVPWMQATAQDRSAQNFAQSVSEQLPNGQKVNPQMLAEVYKVVEQAQPGLTADPRVARFLSGYVLSEQIRSGQAGVPRPAGAPPMSEPSGGQPRSAARVTELDRLVAANRGVPVEKLVDRVKGHQGRGTSFVLEDE